MFNNLRDFYEHIEYSINEFASPTFKARERIQSFSDQIFEHILKIAYLNKQCPQTLEHWSGEIMNWLIQCDKIRIKSTHKSPTKEQIYDWLFEDFTDEESLNTEYIIIYADYNIKINQEKSLKLLKEVIYDLLDLLKDKKLNKKNIIEAILNYEEILK